MRVRFAVDAREAQSPLQQSRRWVAESIHTRRTLLAVGKRYHKTHATPRSCRNYAAKSRVSDGCLSPRAHAGILVRLPRRSKVYLDVSVTRPQVAAFELDFEASGGIWAYDVNGLAAVAGHEGVWRRDETKSA